MPLPSQGSTDLPIREVQLADFRHDVVGGLLGLHEEFGPVAAMQDGVNRVLFVFDSELNKQILSDVTTYETRFFTIRGPKKSSHRRLTCGLLGMNGEQWRRNRRLLKEPFGLKQVASYREAIERMAQSVLESWEGERQVDMNQEMTRFLLEVTSGILFGLDENELAYEIGEQIAEWVTLNHELGIGALIPDVTFSERYEELLRFSEGLEERVMRMITLRQNGPQDGNDVLSILVRTHDDEGGLSDEELVGQSCVLFGAAHLTTSNSLTWTLFLLAQHPTVLQELLVELKQPHNPDKPDPNSLLERVIRESMRMLPASSYSVRLPTRGVTVGPFVDIPRGTPILFSPLVTHRLESVFQNPNQFQPDRWLSIKPSPYEYLPFGAGPRMCIGGTLAMEVLRTSLPLFLRKKMTVVPGSVIDAQIESTMLNPISGVPMTLADHDGRLAASPCTGSVTRLVDMTEVSENR